jgi:hypothetical protein
MADPLPTSPVARFRIWIRRGTEPQGPYSIRFEVTEGKGILRVVRPGVLVDPPARPSGFEERLTAAQVNTSRFLHAWDGGRYRQGHSFARLDEARLEGLPRERWIPLDSAAEGTLSMLLLPATIEAEPTRVDDEPTWPRREMLAELQRDLRGMEARPTDAAALEEPTATNPPPYEAQNRAVSRAERVSIPRTPPTRADAQPAPRLSSSLDALLEASVAHGAGRGGDEDQTILIGSASLALDRFPGAARPALPSPSATWPSEEDEDAIEAGEDDEDDDNEFDVISLNAHQPRFGGGDDDGDSDDTPEVTDIGRTPMPETFQGDRLTEAVTVVPLFDMDTVAGMVEILPSMGEDTSNVAIEAGADEGEDEDDAAFDEASADSAPYQDEADAGLGAAAGTAAPAERARVASPDPETEDDPPEGVPAYELREVEPPAVPVSRAEGEPEPSSPAFHERNTTLVRFLRRRMAADRARIATLEQRVAELEGEIVRRSAR